MLNVKSVSPVVRAVLVMGAVAALVTGVTFAALQSEATLTDNSIVGADALQVNNDPEDATFHQSETGFAFTGIVPGVASSQTENFELMNTSTTTVDVNVQIPSAPSLPAGVDTDDVTFTFDTVPASGSPVTATWAQLAAGDGVALFSGLAGGVTKEFTVKVDVSGAVTVSSVNIPNFTLLFGVPVVAAP